MKKIAIYMDDGDRMSPSFRILGFLKAIEEAEESLCLYIFRSKARRGLDSDYSIGEYNIFSLASPDQFDGVIFELDNLHSIEEDWYGDKVCQKLVERVRKSEVPAISIGNRVEGFVHSGINNYSASKGIIRHLNTVHGCTDFWFIMGPQNNYENQKRTEALTDYCREKGIDAAEERFYFESYKEACGRHGFTALFQRFQRLPEAIVCANDLIVIGVLEEAGKYGYHVPGDFIVTGFDNLESSEIYVPSITTVDQNFTEQGRRSIVFLQRIWNQEELYDEMTVPVKLICRESCGCTVNRERSRLINRAMIAEIERGEADAQLNLLEYELLNCDNLNEIGNVFVKSASFLNCDGLYLVLDQNFNRMGLLQNRADGFLGDDKYEPLVEGYPDKLEVLFAVENGAITVRNKKISGKEITEYFTPEGATDYLFIPIHLKQYTAGFFVIKGSISLIEKPYLNRAIYALTTAIKNHYSREQLNHINNYLKTQSITDPMTGFFNRLGYLERAEAMLAEKTLKNEAMAVVYVDMDRLKQMNDSFGHKCGDNSLIAIAKAIHDNVPRDSLVFRMGGDEFLILTGLSDPDEIEEMLFRIREAIPHYRECRILPYIPTISAGYRITDPDSGELLESYVKQADMVMYRQKTEHKGTVKGS